MQQVTILVLMALSTGTLVVKSSGDEAYDEEKSKEAIRLWVIRNRLAYRIAGPKISESDIQIGQHLLDQVRSGDPAFVVGLEYNCSVNRVQEILDKLYAKQLLSDEDQTDLKNGLTHGMDFTKRYNSSRNQNLVIGHIDVSELTVWSQNQGTIYVYYAFCKVSFNEIAFNELTKNQQYSLKIHLIYLSWLQWLQISGPYGRILMEKYQAYKKYLPDPYRERSS